MNNNTFRSIVKSSRFGLLLAAIVFVISTFKMGINDPWFAIVGGIYALPAFIIGLLFSSVALNIRGKTTWIANLIIITIIVFGLIGCALLFLPYSELAI